MKGPGLKYEMEVRRLWRCSKCGAERRLSGNTTSVPCRCAADKFMQLVDEPKFNRPTNREVDVYVTPEEFSATSPIRPTSPLATLTLLPTRLRSSRSRRRSRVWPKSLTEKRRSIRRQSRNLPRLVPTKRPPSARTQPMRRLKVGSGLTKRHPSILAILMTPNSVSMRLATRSSSRRLVPTVLRLRKTPSPNRNPPAVAEAAENAPHKPVAPAAR
ncbi:MAG: hypothetical protein R3C01_06150 [Planctomycetaceae bacterium]